MIAPFAATAAEALFGIFLLNINALGGVNLQARSNPLRSPSLENRRRKQA